MLSFVHCTDDPSRTKTGFAIRLPSTVCRLPRSMPFTRNRNWDKGTVTMTPQRADS